LFIEKAAELSTAGGAGDMTSRQETNEKNIKTALGSFANPASKTVNILADMSKSLAVIADAMTEENDPDADHKNE
jgi:hypothetical protein